jgi:hypothetical protein
MTLWNCTKEFTDPSIRPIHHPLRLDTAGLLYTFDEPGCWKGVTFKPGDTLKICEHTFTIEVTGSLLTIRLAGSGNPDQASWTAQDGQRLGDDH